MVVAPFLFPLAQHRSPKVTILFLCIDGVKIQMWDLGRWHSSEEPVLLLKRTQQHSCWAIHNCL